MSIKNLRLFLSVSFKYIQGKVLPKSSWTSLIPTLWLRRVDKHYWLKWKSLVVTLGVLASRMCWSLTNQAEEDNKNIWFSLNFYVLPKRYAHLPSLPYTIWRSVMSTPRCSHIIHFHGAEIFLEDLFLLANNVVQSWHDLPWKKRFKLKHMILCILRANDE